jgi:predicted signal transduction protein with EAL and GGDEF domain
MGNSLNLRVIAEGIETLEQLEFLRKHNCLLGQGYYFSRPVPADEMSTLLSRGSLNATDLAAHHAGPTKKTDGAIRSAVDVPPH